MNTRRIALAYVFLVGLPLLGLVGILHAGSHLTALMAVRGNWAVSAAWTPFTLILQIAVIVIAARVFGLLFRLINQPQVIGEMVAGILLGPSLLGWVAPKASAFLFPPPSLMYLNTLSQVGILIYMFLVGAALNHKELKSHGHAAILTSHVSIIVPFFLGALLAVALYPRLSDNGVTFTGFALFMGAAMSITAFPVLARILTDRSMLSTRLGTLAIACAAVDDITGWRILAYIVVVIRAHSGLTPMWVTVGGTVGFALIMIYGVKRLLRGFYTPTGVVAHCHGDFERDERNAGIPGRKYTHPSELHFGSRGGVQWHTLSAVVGGACNCVRIPR